MAEPQLDLKAVLDGFGQGVVIFASDGRLLAENLAARNLFGTDLNLIRAKGWDAVSTLFNSRQLNPDQTIETAREKALTSPRPVRFYIYRSGEHVPCWVSAVQTVDGEVCTMITLDQPDWSAITRLIDRFRDEMREAIQSTQGHIDLITKTIAVHKPEQGVELLGKRVSGFTRLINVHMVRVGRLMDMLERLENIRTGRLREIVRERRRRIALDSFFEDFAEALDEVNLIDPESEEQDVRSRLVVSVPKGAAVGVSSLYLTRILHDMLRNAIMYSWKATPIQILVQVKTQGVQIDVIDQGYGVREKEREKVFEEFARARQPQIVAEFGYGLSLHLCKHEVEAMNGRMWFESVEGVGTTFSLLLPQWRDESEAVVSSESDRASSSDTDTNR
jgi:signal transduction histidine kinase